MARWRWGRPVLGLPVGWWQVQKTVRSWLIPFERMRRALRLLAEPQQVFSVDWRRSGLKERYPLISVMKRYQKLVEISSHLLPATRLLF